MVVTPSTAFQPTSSVAPKLNGAFTPAPASQTENPFGLWSRPLAPFWKVGMRPNSVVKTTSVSSSSPRASRSSSSAAAG